MIGKAIRKYHELIAEGDTAQETHDLLFAELKERELFFGDVPVCRVLRPQFFEHDDWVYLKTQTEIVLQAFRKTHFACLENADLRSQLDLDPYEEELFALDKGLSAPWSSSRLDAFYKPEDRYLRFVEYNAETPAGIGYGDELATAFLNIPVMKEFQKLYNVAHHHGQTQLLDVIVRAYREWGGTQPMPNIAIVDWQDVPTLREHKISCAYFEEHGFRCILADPQHLEFRDGFLWHEDLRIDLIYKRVLYSELVERMGMECDLVKALKARAVFMTNSPSAKLISKKASLALLSDEQNRHLFTREELAAIAQHIPWTRRVSDRKTFYNGAEIDLLEFLRNHRENFVLKPNDDYGGHGVVIGWQATENDWENTIQAALTVPHVVQERVTLVERDFPMMLDGTLDISPRFVDANPYVFYGTTVGGCLTRLSSAALLNVTAGAGSVVPMFVIENR
ncbi:MAG: circularly permuted type 2 ATP-grasp protein [Aggregatilineales bacterium]